MKYTPYSFSKLITHKNCNRKFLYNYIEKIPKDKIDMIALKKGSAIHSILKNYPSLSTNKFQHIVDKFIQTKLGNKYLSRESIREFDFGLSKDLRPSRYSDRESLFRGSIDFICIIDDDVDEIIEVDSISDIPHDYEIIEVLET